MGIDAREHMLESEAFELETPPPPETSPPWSTSAVWGFALALAWLGGLGSIAALFLGIRAVNETAHGLRGKGLAVSAIILGALGVLALGVAGALYLTRGP